MRYFIFSGENYYPFGGMLDYICSVDSVDEAKRWFHDNRETMEMDGSGERQHIELEWCQIVDANTGKIVTFGDRCRGCTEWGDA